MTLMIWLGGKAFTYWRFLRETSVGSCFDEVSCSQGGLGDALEIYSPGDTKLCEMAFSVLYCTYQSRNQTPF